MPHHFHDYSGELVFDIVENIILLIALPGIFLVLQYGRWRPWATGYSIIAAAMTYVAIDSYHHHSPLDTHIVRLIILLTIASLPWWVIYKGRRVSG